MRNKFYCFLALSIVLAGCGKVYLVDPIIKTDNSMAITWKECTRIFWYCNEEDKTEYINPYTYNPEEADDKGKLNKGKDSYYKLASNKIMFINYTSSSAKMAKFYRNKLQNAIIGVSYPAIEGHLASAKATGTNVNTALGLITTGLAGYGSVAATVTSQAMAASAAGTNAARSLFNEETFRNNMAETLAKSVRTDIVGKILYIKNMQNKSIFEYDIESAITDAKILHISGSVNNGLTLVQQAGEKAIADKQKTFGQYSSASKFLIN